MTDIVDRLLADPGPAELTELIRTMVEQRHEAADEIERLRTDKVSIVVKAKDAEIARLTALVKDLADDLEAELNGHYPPEVRAYPSEQRRYERDMANVYAARRVLEKAKPAP